ncbi:TetR/AcrR family transcriptional regulator [Corallincola platygyrae]|uniref:TetR/AcrR family transcriptional regulator n=1 Tax=Corallincola platygyrae TaxID=1193278 RepID=A0ABW4XRF3_9GAMM
MNLSVLKHQDILSAAMELFKAKGFQGTTMQAIADAAGVSKRTLYRHFPNKDKLFSRLIGELSKQCIQNVTIRFKPDQPLASQLRQLLEEKLALFENPDFLWLVRIAVPELIICPERARLLTEVLHHQEGPLTQWLKDANDAGAIDCLHPISLAKQVQGMLDGTALWPQLLGGSMPLNSQEKSDLISNAIRFITSSNSQSPFATLPAAHALI